MTDTTEKDKDPVVYSSRRKRSLKRLRLMDIDKSANSDQLPPDTPIAIYSRVSSEEQVHGYSLEAQVNACMAFAAQRKWKIVRFYSDPGHSAKDDNRPDFAKMIAHAQEQQFKAIIFHKLDRFSRNIENTLRYFRDLNSYDVLIASVTEDFDFTTAQGRLVFRMMALFAQWYLENLSAEVVKSKVEMARHGVQNGPVPFGYIKDKERNKIFIVEEEAQLVRAAYELYASGNYTDQTIADFMNQSGIKTRKGNKWSKDTVTDFLQNEFFYGKVAYRDQLWPGRHQAIITKELFDRVKEVRTRHAVRPRSHLAFNKLRRVSLLRRIVCCSQCERPLRVQSVKGYGYYIETSLYRGKDCVDSHARVRMDVMDQMVFDLLRNVQLPEAWQKDIERMIRDMDVVRKIENRRLEIEDELRRAGRAFADGAFNEDDYDRRRKKLISEKDSLVVPDGAKAIEMGMQLETIGDFINEATDDEKYKILRILFDAVYYDFGQKRLVGFKPHAEFVPIFRLAAPLSGWSEKEGFIFRTIV
jgi:DNA invertase Pin-like site-specific DNA recombinase